MLTPEQYLVPSQVYLYDRQNWRHTLQRRVLVLVLFMDAFDELREVK